MDRIRTSLTLALALPLIAAIAIGCNTGTEEPEAPSSGAAATSGSETGAAAVVPPADIDPSRFPELAHGVVAAVPDNFPSDLPVYPGSVAAQGRGTTDEGGDMAAVQLLTNDSPEQAYDYYRNELESKGWAIGDTPPGADGESAISVTKDGCKAVFMFVPSTNGPGTDIFTISSCEG